MIWMLILLFVDSSNVYTSITGFSNEKSCEIIGKQYIEQSKEASLYYLCKEVPKNNGY